jgi:hypothetical protein
MNEHRFAFAFAIPIVPIAQPRSALAQVEVPRDARPDAARRTAR